MRLRISTLDMLICKKSHEVSNHTDLRTAMSYSNALGRPNVEDCRNGESFMHAMGAKISMPEVYRTKQALTIEAE